MATRFLDAKWFSKADWLRMQPQVEMEDHSLGSDAVVRIESVCCERINEISKDEIRLLCFWSTPDGEISGIMQQSFNFKRKGESQVVDLAIQLDGLTDDKIFLLMLYEADLPPLDSHDPIGCICFFPNGGAAIFSGNFKRSIPSKTTTMKAIGGSKVDFDAGPKGCYSLEIHLGNE